MVSPKVSAVPAQDTSLVKTIWMVEGGMSQSSFVVACTITWVKLRETISPAVLEYLMSTWPQSGELSLYLGLQISNI